jgi:hypothetical protein
MKSGHKFYLIALLAAVLVLSSKVGLQEVRYPAFDEYRYLQTAKLFAELEDPSDLMLRGTLAKVSMVELPLTPMFLAVFLRVDRTFYKTISCILKSRAIPDLNVRQCPHDYGFYIPFQVLIAAFSVSLVWLIARNLGASAPASMLAFLLALGSGQYDSFARTFLTESLLLYFLSIFLLGMSLVIGPNHKKRMRDIGLVIVGVGLGFCALNRQGYVFLAYAVFVGIFWMHAVAISSKGQVRRRFVCALRSVLILSIPFAIVVSPWLIRNVWVFGTWALVDSHDAHVIVERISYNVMSWNEWAAGWVFWLPDFGDKLAPALFGDEAVRRLGWDDKSSFYQYSNGALQAIIRSEAEAAGLTRLRYVITHYIFGDLAKHSAVSLVLGWRGLWIGDYFGLVTQLLSAIGMWIFVRQRRFEWALALGLPAFFIVGFHSFVSVSIPRYNIIMLPYLCILSALTIEIVGRAVWTRYTRYSQV